MAVITGEQDVINNPMPAEKQEGGGNAPLLDRPNLLREDENQEEIAYESGYYEYFWETISDERLTILLSHKKDLEKDVLKALKAMKKWTYDKKLKCRKKKIIYYQKFGGRLYPKGESLVTLPSRYRNYLCQEYYYDVDIVNCQPSLLLNECEKYGINKFDVTNLKNYVENREELLEEVSEEYNITRSEAKDLFLKTVFGMGEDSLEAEIEDDLPVIIENLRKEVVDIRSVLVGSEKYKDFIEKVNKEKPKSKKYWAGSYLSFILARREWIAIKTMMEFFNKEGWKVSFLEFDGGKIKRKKEKSLNDSVISECEDYIKKKTGLTIKLKIKAMETDIDYGDEDDEFNDPEYLEFKENLEKNHFKLLNPVCYVYEDGENISMLNKTSLEEKFVEDSEFIGIWRKDKNKRQYNKIDFLPNNHDPTIYNTFKGFLAEKIECDEIEDMSLLNHHLLNLCNGKQEYVEWLYDYCCHMVGKPEEKPEIAVNMKSEEGEGKNTYWEWFLGYLLNPEYIYVTEHLPDIFDRFSIALKNRLCVVIEETDGATGFKFDERIKGKITCTYDKFEQKGFQAFTINSLIRYVFFSNNETHRKVTGSNRRDVFFEGTGRYAGGATQHPEYFDKLYEYLYKPSTIKTYFNFLKNRYEEKQITKKILMETRPVTDTHREMSTATIPKEMFFFKEEFEVEEDEEEKIFDYEQTNFIYSRYKKYMDRNFSGYPKKDLRNFGKILSKIGFERKRNNGSHWILDKSVFEEYCGRKNFLVNLI